MTGPTKQLPVAVVVTFLDLAALNALHQGRPASFPWTVGRLGGEFMASCGRQSSEKPALQTF
jgi:hypothetical protein